MSEWISVKDRLPSLNPDESLHIDRPSDEVLIHVPGKPEYIVGYLTTYGWSEYYGTSCGCCGDNGPLQGAVTHWMPLPEPPK